MIRLFCGHDPREAVGFHVFVASVLRYASEPVNITALGACGLPEGSNTFTKSRFLVPMLCGYEGWAIFADGADMLMTTDIAKLQYDFDPTYAVQVVKHEYKTRHPIKYKGTEMMCPNMDYPRKNWASVMLINCEHELWRAVKPAFVRDMPDKRLLQFGFLPDEAIGDLPDEWNRLVDEGQDPEGAAILHWTAGIPGFPEYRNAPGAGLWHLEKRLMEFV